MIRQVTEFFGATHPIRVGTGVCIGIAIHGGLSVAAGTYPDTVWITKAAALHVTYFVAATLGLVFLPLTIGGRGAPESAVNTIRIIRALMDAANYSSQKRNLIWQALIQKYIDAIRPDLTKAPSATEMFKEAERETSDTAEV